MMTKGLTPFIEKNLIPDQLIRLGIRKLLRQRLQDASTLDQDSLIASFDKQPIAVLTRAANEQHYEVPTEFFRYVMGRHMKYSCGWWEGADTLDASEAAMLALTCERAQLVDGQDILELGCGWGSLSLWMAEHYPKSRITGVSNSRTQKQWIDQQAKDRGLNNLTILTCDMNTFSPPGVYDRIVSVEMFEHMRNHRELLRRVAGWLRTEGKLFVHVFVHKQYTYLFEPKDETDWMSRYFFAGGMMPAAGYLPRFQQDLQLEERWDVNGTHYAKTSEAWLQNMDRHRREIRPILEETYGKDQATKWWVYWRIFFMACAELWNFRGGSEWFVSHYLFKQRAR